MKTLEILKTRKNEIVNLTMELLPDAINGNNGMFIANLAFNFKVDDNNELSVDYYTYVGNQKHSENVFYTIPSHELEGCLDVNDFDNWASFIEDEIDQYILTLEYY